MKLRSHRRTLASLFLGVWLFALFAGIASACLWGTEAEHAQVSSMTMGSALDDHSPAPGCKEFCKADTPVLTKLQVWHHPPVAPPLVVASLGFKGFISGTSQSPAQYLAHPPPDVPALLRTLRLAL
jgi:hypothetical protein